MEIMAKEEVKSRASSTMTDPGNGGAANPLQEEMAAPSPTMVNGEGKFEDEGTDKPYSTKIKDDEQVARGGGGGGGGGGGEEQAGEYWEDDDGEDEDEDGNEVEGEGRMEVGDEEAEEGGRKKEEEIVEEALQMTKTEEETEVNSGGMVKNLMIRGVACADEDKPRASSKKRVASAVKDKPEALSKKEVAATTEDNPKASIKKKSVTTTDDQPEASSKKMVKKVKSTGLIFLCNSKTKQDCYRYKVLGLPASQKDLVQKIYKGMRLFLFDIDLRLMYGIYKAAGPGGYNIQPKAFGSAFPSQVRFAVSEDCLPLAEEKFKPILKENYYAKTKFDCQLNSGQVKKLCKLFNGSGRVSKSKKFKNVVGTKTRPGADRARSWRLMGDGESLDRGRMRRQILDNESVERGRIKQQILDEERLDRDRIRRQRLDEGRLDQGRVRRQKLDEENWEPLYHDRQILYERERYASPLPPHSLAYDSYGRITETAMYIGDRVVDHRDRVPALEHQGRVSAVGHRGLRILDLDARRREEVGICDPYTSYGVYDLAPRVQAVTYVPLVSSASEYRRHEALQYEYGPPQPLY